MRAAVRGKYEGEYLIILIQHRRSKVSTRNVTAESNAMEPDLTLI